MLDGPHASVDAERADPRGARQADEPVELRRVRVRQAGGRYFVDLVVGVPSDTGVTQAHAIADDVEGVVEERSAAPTWSSTWSRASRAAACASAPPPPRSSVPEVREVHNVRVMQLPEGYELSLHVKLPRELSLDDAHGVVERLEELIRAAVPELRKVHTHIEPLAGTDWAQPPRERRHRRRARGDRGGGAARTGAAPASVSFRDGEGGRIALVTIKLPGDAAAALRAPPRRRDRGGRARALPDAGRRDRAHRARRGRSAQAPARPAAKPPPRAG